MKSFETLNTDYQANLGCRGVGRLLWLKAFDKVSVGSGAEACAPLAPSPRHPGPDRHHARAQRGALGPPVSVDSPRGAGQRLRGGVAVTARGGEAEGLGGVQPGPG